MLSRKMRTIVTKAQFNTELQNIMHKESIKIGNLEITATKKLLDAVYTISNNPVSRVYTSKACEASVTLEDNGHLVTIENKFSWEFLSISLKNFAVKRAKAIFSNATYIVKCANGQIRVFNSLGKRNRLTELKFNGGSYSIHEVYEMGEVHIYKGLAWTASNKRQKSLVCMEVTHEDRRFEVLDKATMGAFTMLKNKYGIRKNRDAVIELQKKGGYVGNVLTGSVNFGKVPGYVRFFNKWKKATEEFFLTEEYKKAKEAYLEAMEGDDLEAIEAARLAFEEVQNRKPMLEGAATIDGQMFVNSVVFSKMILKAFNILIDPDVLEGMIIQLRPGTIKASALIVPPEVFEAMVKSTKAIALSNIAKAREEAEAMSAEDAAKHIKKAEEENRVAEIGDPNEMLFIADANCVKLDYDMTMEMTMEVLAFAKCSDGNTSKQMLESVFYLAQQLGVNASQLTFDIVQNTIDGMLHDRLVKREVKLLTPEEIEKAVESGFINDVVLAIKPDFIDENKAFFNSVVRQAVNSAVDAISRMAGKINSHNRRLGSDASPFLCANKIDGILRTGEVFINDRFVSKVVMVKYPKMGLREYYAATNVSLKTIKNRVNALLKQDVITAAEASAIIAYFRSIDSFVAILPATTVVTYACAGLDYDYDGAIFIEYSDRPRNDVEEMTNKLVDIFFSQEMKAVIIENE